MTQSCSPGAPRDAGIALAPQGEIACHDLLMGKCAALPPSVGLVSWDGVVRWVGLARRAGLASWAGVIRSAGLAGWAGVVRWVGLARRVGANSIDAGEASLGLPISSSFNGEAAFPPQSFEAGRAAVATRRPPARPTRPAAQPTSPATPHAAAD
jgi:hypothetical protein